MNAADTSQSPPSGQYANKLLRFYTPQGGGGSMLRESFSYGMLTCYGGGGGESQRVGISHALRAGILGHFTGDFRLKINFILFFSTIQSQFDG